jgi:hypothetical protein
MAFAALALAVLEASAPFAAGASLTATGAQSNLLDSSAAVGNPLHEVCSFSRVPDASFV